MLSSGCGAGPPPPAAARSTAAGLASHLRVSPQLGAGALVALLLVGYEVLLGNAIAATSVDALHFSLHPLVPARLAFAVGLILAQAVVFWAAILVVVMVITFLAHRRAPAASRWRRSRCRRFPSSLISHLSAGDRRGASTVPALPTAFAGLACLALAWGMSWARPRYRHASQALRLFAGALVLLIPAFVLYPSVHHFADRGLRRLIEEEYARQANDQRAELQDKLRDRASADRCAGRFQILPRATRPQPNRRTPRSSSGRNTNLATERLASSLELYDPQGGSWPAASR